MEEDTEQTTKVSKFNSTIAILIRIDKLWQDAHTHSRNGQLMKWNWDLDRVWCELIDDNYDKNVKEFDKLNEEVDANMKNPPVLYKKIMAKEIFLRLLQNKQGKGIAYEDNIDDYMD